MYKAFFGLDELPFSIAPNPQYLYMSDRHREALAHLMFGLSETGGFVLLTGEVGTGKTTTSRCLLEQVPENTQVAFILNPTLTEHELLATICDELSIQYGSTPTIKDFTDSIRDYLLAHHEAGKNTLLIIDEAQHLRPEVLEQLRLLTNLETNTKKLLQVILIGQPELQDLLRKQELRQLAQRITARYHLLPLTLEEVAAYVHHRVKIAGCERPLFTTNAIKVIHQLSGGIPRIINLLCDRALMGAFSRSSIQADVKTVQQAGIEVLGQSHLDQKSGVKQLKPWQVFCLAMITFFLCIYLGWWLGQPNDTNQTTEATQIVETVPEVEAVTHANSTPALEINEPAFVQPSDVDYNHARSFRGAFFNLLEIWRVDTTEIGEDICYQVIDWQLACYILKGSLPSVINLNYPALLELHDPNGDAFYAVLSSVDPDSQSGIYQLQFDGVTQFVDQAWFDEHWQGSAIVIWQVPNDFQGAIKADSDPEQFQWLENTLAYALEQRPRVVNNFDSQLQRLLHKFQQVNNLPITPYADEETIIALHHIVNPDLPQIHVNKNQMMKDN